MASDILEVILSKKEYEIDAILDLRDYDITLVKNKYLNNSYI
jgi:hypothetical protein